MRPDAVFDGELRHERWSVVVLGEQIIEAGPNVATPEGSQTIGLPGATLLPGLIDAHTHVLLQPYATRSYDDQLLRDGDAYRVAHAIVALERTLDAGFTTLRDLGTEGAGDADVGLRRALDEGLIRGPRLLCATRAIVARGTYFPSGFVPDCICVHGAEEVDGPDSIQRATRSQIRSGADWIKIYADYPFGPRRAVTPTFSQDDLALAVRVAHDAGVPVAAHATSLEGMRRAVLAGVDTIEHGSAGDEEVFALMTKHAVALLPTLAASEEIERVRQIPPDDPRVAARRASFDAALRSGVTIANGSDAGVFAHGENVHELELLVAGGMSAREALRAATTVAAKVLRRDDIGRIHSGARADLIAVRGDPTSRIDALRNISFVMKNGAVHAHRNS